MDTENYEFKNAKTSLVLTEEEIKKGDRLLKGMGIDPQKDWFVCIHSRDGAYLEKHFPNVNWNHHNVRISNIDNYKESVKLLNDKDVIAGIKVDTGAKSLSAFKGEKITEGLDGLRERLQEYFDIGARFAKWRAVITIDKDIPSDLCILANAHALARYASLCQESGLVPIVEPEVLMEGSHSIETCYEISQRTLNVVFEQLCLNHVMLEGIILKPNMVIPALDCENQADVSKVAEMTFKCLKDNAPSEVPGIAFLSGGQSSDLATAHLSKMNEKFLEETPWNLTFSYGRALQQDALNTWKGKNRKEAQKAFLDRANNNSLATLGEV